MFIINAKQIGLNILINIRLGMYHNHHDKCLDPGDDIYFDDISDGTMESHYYRWNDCNRYYLNATVPYVL